MGNAVGVTHSIEKELKRPISENVNYRVFSSNSNIQLAQDICEKLGVNLGRAVVTKFRNGETRIEITDNVRLIPCFIVAPVVFPVNDAAMELLIMIDALCRASSMYVCPVISYFGYSKQEKKSQGREPITAKLFANLLVAAGANRIITMDLHAAAIQGFFDIPVDNLTARLLFEDNLKRYIKQHNIQNEDLVIVSPDAGGVARAERFREGFPGAQIAVIFKKRLRPDHSQIIEIVGKVQGKIAFMIDDLIITGGTLRKGSRALKRLGAVKVICGATHPNMTYSDLNKIKRSCSIDEIWITNTIHIPQKKLSDKIKVLSVAGLFSKSIKIVQTPLASMSRLFLRNGSVTHRP